MYKINDLKRLKKADLLKIINDAKIDGCKSKTKCQLIDKLVRAGVCEGVCPDVPAPNECQLTELPVDMKSEFLHYQPMTDDKLVGVPNCTFVQLYRYMCGDAEITMKALDRAVQHASAGDISDVKLCQVCVGLNAVA